MAKSLLMDDLAVVPHQNHRASHGIGVDFPLYQLVDDGKIRFGLIGIGFGFGFKDTRHTQREAHEYSGHDNRPTGKIHVATECVINRKQMQYLRRIF